MDNALQELEVTLKNGRQRVVVSPYGASLRRYFVVGEDGSETDIVWGYSNPHEKKGGQGDVLIPFPGRVREGRYSLNGQSYQMEQNDKETPSAIHGFLRHCTWEFETEGDMEVFFRAHIRPDNYAERGYPFSLDVELTYDLMETGLTCGFDIINVGDQPAPIGVGFHPYFVVGTDTINEAEVRIPATQFLEFENMLPTGNLLPVEGSPFDFRHSRRVGDTQFNHCFTGLFHDDNELVNVILKNPENGRSVTVWTEPSLPYLVVYTGDAIPAPDGRKALAIEPMTCATDAFNHPEWGLKVLQPGEEFNGEYGVTFSGF